MYNKESDHWIEYNIDKVSDALSVGSGFEPSGYMATLTYTCSEESFVAELKIGANYKTITAHIFDGRGKELTEMTDSWSFEVIYDNPKEITVSQTGNKFKIKVSDNNKLIGTELLLNATELTHNVTVTETFDIVGF